MPKTSRTLERLCIEADPDFNKDKRVTTEYRFSNGVEKKGITNQRGAYAPE